MERWDTIDPAAAMMRESLERNGMVQMASSLTFPPINMQSVLEEAIHKFTYTQAGQHQHRHCNLFQVWHYTGRTRQAVHRPCGSKLFPLGLEWHSSQHIPRLAVLLIVVVVFPTGWSFLFTKGPLLDHSFLSNTFSIFYLLFIFTT